jgi:hypothetical protein
LGGTIIEFSKKQPHFVCPLSIFLSFESLKKFRHPSRKKNFWQELATGLPTDEVLGGVEEVEPQSADRVLERLNNAGGQTEGCSVN